MALKVLVKSDIKEKAKELRKTGQNVKKELPREVFKTLTKLEASIKNNIRRRSGLNVRSGTLLNSVQKEMKVNGDTIEGTVGPKGVPYAAVHEFGADMPARTITPRNAKALRWFDSSGNAIFAKRVEIPSFRVPARPYLQPAIDEISPELEDKFGLFIELIASKEN